MSRPSGLLERSGTRRPGATRAPGGAAAQALSPVLAAFLGDRVPVHLELWDGSSLGPPAEQAAGTVVLHSPRALQRLVWAPGELGLARAYVAGDIDLDGDVFATLDALNRASRVERDRAGWRALPALVRAALSTGALGPPPAPPPEEARPEGRLHSLTRDAAAISHHYDVGNEFYRLVLGPSLTYSCARYATPGMSLTEAQSAKHELICRKLGLHERPGARLLDVGCGWGSMALHAAAHHGASVVGVTLSAEQAEAARERVAAAGLQERVEIRLEDYRNLGGERFDAISSVGMFEHVGSSQAGTYFSTLHSLLAPTGRLCNHAISSVGGSRIGPRSFIGRYVFPDGELQDVGDVVLAMEAAGFEVRDVESLREHYSTTLRAWVANLEADWDRAVSLAGEGRARVWRLYMAASALGFEDGGLALHQVLGVRPDGSGRSGMAPTRSDWG